MICKEKGTQTIPKRNDRIWSTRALTDKWIETGFRKAYVKMRLIIYIIFLSKKRTFNDRFHLVVTICGFQSCDLQMHVRAIRLHLHKLFRFFTVLIRGNFRHHIRRRHASLHYYKAKYIKHIFIVWLPLHLQLIKYKQYCTRCLQGLLKIAIGEKVWDYDF